jgi:tetratricopeptide (TPR) repeat protein
MKSKLLMAVGLLSLLCGCAVSRFDAAEGQLKRQEYIQALRSYLGTLEPHAREGKRYIYYERESVTGIGVVYWHMQRNETALKILKLVTEKDPGYGKAHFYTGLAYESLGDEDNALAAYGAYGKVDPSDPYRQVMAGRLDYVVKQKIAHEIETAMQNGDKLDAGQYPERSVAVLPFLSLSESADWEPLQKGLADIVVADLAQVKELRVVDRLKADRLASELGLRAAGLTDSAATLRFGKFIGAKTLVKGSYLVMSDLKMTLDAGIFPFQNPANPTTFNEDGNLSRLFQMEKQIVLKIIDYFGITLLPLQKEQLLEIPTQNLGAFMNYCRGLEALDANSYKTAHEFFREAVRSDPGFQKARDWLIAPEVWDATHAQNLNRVDRDVAYLTRSGIWNRINNQAQPDFMSTTGRLQWMGMKQNAGLLPGTDSRKSFQEAGIMINGWPILPRMLGTPPPPAR